MSFFSFKKQGLDKQPNNRNIETKNEKKLFVGSNCGTEMGAVNNASPSVNLVWVKIVRHIPQPDLPVSFTVNYHGGTSGNVFSYYPTGINALDACECDVKITGVFSTITLSDLSGTLEVVNYNSHNTSGIYLLEDYFQLACSKFTITVN